jgi:hypothetical protein
MRQAAVIAWAGDNCRDHMAFPKMNWPQPGVGWGRYSHPPAIWGRAAGEPITTVAAMFRSLCGPGVGQSGPGKFSW